MGPIIVFQDTIRKENIPCHVLGPRRPNENPAEGVIRDIQMRCYKLQTRKNVPNQLWAYDLYV